MRVHMVAVDCARVYELSILYVFPIHLWMWVEVTRGMCHCKYIGICFIIEFVVQMQ